jgi:hypothetical protein
MNPGRLMILNTSDQTSTWAWRSINRPSVNNGWQTRLKLMGQWKIKRKFNRQKPASGDISKESDLTTNSIVASDAEERVGEVIASHQHCTRRGRVSLRTNRNIPRRGQWVVGSCFFSGRTNSRPPSPELTPRLWWLDKPTLGRSTTRRRLLAPSWRN